MSKAKHTIQIVYFFKRFKIIQDSRDYAFVSLFFISVWVCEKMSLFPPNAANFLGDVSATKDRKSLRNMCLKYEMNN